jgi:polar amino acid transport system permease protein
MSEVASKPRAPVGERIVTLLARLPWWIIIITIVGVAVGYSVLTSELYIKAIRFVTDDPHLTTQDRTAVTYRLKEGGAVAGILVEEDEDSVSVRNREGETIVVPRSDIERETLREPAVCALNNLAGCNEGIFLTLRATLMGFALSLVFGLVFGMMRVARNPILYSASTLYVEVIRGVPLLVVLLYAGFVISPWIRDNMGVELTDVQEAVIGLAFCYGAYEAEVFRAGIESIHRGQMEAARSLGMSYFQAMRYVVLPQAIRVVLPPLGNDFISMLKDSALISVLALPDMLQMGRLWISRNFRAFEGYNTVAILYLLMTLFLSMMVRVIERRSKLPG